VIAQLGWDGADMGGARRGTRIEPLAVLWCITRFAATTGTSTLFICCAASCGTLRHGAAIRGCLKR